MRTLIRSVSLNVQLLEAREVPSTTAPDVDLTTSGASGSIDGAIFRQFDAQPTGTGFIDSFVRLQAKGAGAQVEQGFNTDARPLQFDENKSPQFTRSLKLSDVPEVDIGGILYREFLLDINQKSSQPFLSLDALRIYVGSAGNLTGLDPSPGGELAGLTAVYDLDTGGDHWVKLDARLSHGSGSGDMLLYVPSSYFGSDPNAYVYLYSRFGDHFMANAGFEEWAVSTSSTPLTCTHATISGQVTDTLGTGIANVVVFLDANNNGVLDSNEIYTVTDANGNYTFSNLASGMGDLTTYNVRIIPPLNYIQLTPNPDPISLTDCESNGIADFVLAPSQPNS